MLRTHLLRVSVVLCCGLLASRATAQFDAFTWTTVSGGGSAFVSGDSMTIFGADGANCPGGSTTKMTATAPYAATVLVDLDFVNHDKGGGGFDWAVYIVNGQEEFITESNEALVGFDVAAGATFGFGVHSVDCTFGEGIATLTGLVFIPHEVGMDVAGTQLEEAFGAALASVGDLDDDGVSELLVGAPQADAPALDSGRVTLLSGASGAVVRVINGGQAGEAFGSAVAGGGDANDDGVPDIVIGAPLNDAGGTDAGLVRVYSGATTGLLHTLTNPLAGDRFGSSVAFVGDIDGDDHDDILVGAPRRDAGPGNEGGALVFSGASGGILLTLTGTAPNDQFGFSVAGLGDVNGDLVPDLLIGAPYDDDVAMDSGSARLVSGLDGSQIMLLYHGNPQPPQQTFGDAFGWAVAGAGDVNADGLPDLIVGAPQDHIGSLFYGSGWVFSGADGAVLHNFNGGGLADHLGAVVAGAGDVDGDGHADLAVGVPQNDVSPAKVGIVIVFSGRDGKVLSADAAASVDDNLGASVAAMGDTDGDGRPDLAVGAPGHDGGALDGGRAYVLHSKLRWSYVGSGLAGTHGEPWLAGDGLLFELSPLALELTNALENVSAALVVGLGVLNAPFKGGVLVPTVDALITGLPTGASGSVTLLSNWPPGIPTGTAVYLQAWLPDPAGPQGFAASRGLKITTP